MTLPIVERLRDDASLLNDVYEGEYAGHLYAGLHGAADTIEELVEALRSLNCAISSYPFLDRGDGSLDRARDEARLLLAKIGGESRTVQVREFDGEGEERWGTKTRQADGGQ